MGRILAFVYGAVSYLIFFVTFLYAIGFVGNVFVPKAIDSGVPGPFTTSLVINAVLLSLFAIQHSVMARPGFKKAWTKIVPPAIERSTYVLLAILRTDLPVLVGCAVPAVLGPLTDSAARADAAVRAGLVFLTYSEVLADLAVPAVVAVPAEVARRSIRSSGFKTPGLYKLVRHPIMLGFIIAFWATPKMTVGHLVFAFVTTVYILVAIQFEERDMIGVHGETYEEYRRRVPMLLPIPKGK